MFWNLVTDFGDSAAMLPAAALLLGWLAATGQARAAVLWAALFAGQAGLVAGTKIAFRGWGVGIEAIDFTGISGHATLACSVIPIGFFLAARRAGPIVAGAALTAGFAAGAVIGFSRVALYQHSWSEVVAGCGLGSLTAVLFLTLAREVRGAARVPTPLLAAAAASVVLVLHGTHAPSERLITRIALRLSGHESPYMRAYPGYGWSRPYAGDAREGAADAAAVRLG